MFRLGLSMILISAKWLAGTLQKWLMLSWTAGSVALWCLVAPSGGSILLPYLHPPPPSSAHYQRELIAAQVFYYQLF